MSGRRKREESYLRRATSKGRAMTLYIGLAGRIGSGKTVVSKHLQDNYGANERRFSEILEEILGTLRFPIKREYLQKLGKVLREEFGHGILVEVMKKKLEEETSDAIVVDGVRYENEVDMLRSLEDSILIFVSAPSELRYERVVKRGTRGEAAISYDDFLKNEEAATEREVGAVEKQADFILENVGTIEELLLNLDKIIKEKL